jgi:hypothetical protein
MDVFSHSSPYICGRSLIFCPVKNPCGLAVVPLKMLLVTDQLVTVGIRLETLTPSRSANWTLLLMQVRADARLAMLAHRSSGESVTEAVLPWSARINPYWYIALKRIAAYGFPTAQEGKEKDAFSLTISPIGQFVPPQSVGGSCWRDILLMSEYPPVQLPVPAEEVAGHTNVWRVWFRISRCG